MWRCGFCKTEIAMRTAFLILSSGFQVAIVCPKVLLVNQHFNTFSKDLLISIIQLKKYLDLKKPQKKKKSKKKLN